MSYKKMKKAFLEGKGKLKSNAVDAIIMDEVVPQVAELVKEGEVKIIDPITIKADKPKAKKTPKKTKATKTTKAAKGKKK